MYDELIKNLRGRSQFLLPHYGEETSYDSDLMKQAADAIEELQADKDALNGTVSNLIQQIAELAKDINVPRWIPVTEWLPEEPGMYIVFLRCGAELQDTGFPEDLSYVTAMHFDSDQRIWNDGIESYNANLDVVNKPHAYYITHWMPLPSTEGLNET